MSELDQFETRVRQNIKLLSSPNAKARRKAAAWLGEAGDPNAITRLKQIYDEDPDGKVRDAAAYSLGMFRALEQGMNSEDSDKVFDLLEEIALKNKMGGRVRIPVSTMSKVIAGLLVSLIILLAFNFVVWPQFEGQINDALGIEALADAQAGGSAQVQGREAVMADIDVLRAAIGSDVTTLQSQYSVVQAGGQVDCAASFSNPVVYDISQAGDASDLSAIATNLNGQIINLITAKAPYNQACPDNAASLTADQLAGPQATLVALQTALAAIDSDIAAAKGEVIVPTPTQEGVTAPDPTVVPPDIAANLSVHLTPLFTILDEARSVRGSVTALNAFWEGVSDNVVASGCNEPVPAIAENYILPESDAQASVNLKLSVDLLNTGLAFTRQGWDLRQTSCAASDLLNNRETGLTLAINARIAFDNAETTLSRVRESLR